jgi:hypothetical protein
VSATSNEFDYESPTVPVGALFVAADEPLLVFPSATAAERWLEAIDVENGVYPAAYGPNGEPFSIDNERNRVVIEPTGEPNKPDELKALLLRYLEATARPADGSLDLHELVAMVWAIQSEFWQEHDPYSDRFGTRIPIWGCVAFVAAAALALYLMLR